MRKHIPWYLLAAAALVPVYAKTFEKEPESEVCEVLPEAIDLVSAIAMDSTLTTLAPLSAALDAAENVNDLHWRKGCTPCARWEIAESLGKKLTKGSAPQEQWNDFWRLVALASEDCAGPEKQKD